nr:uncharacterized mitochondrial protein AtMg00810-like [Tanacetum cinerariifolium]
MGELTFFLGLQVKLKKDGIFISQDKYVAEILRKFGLTDGKSASTPIDTEKPLLKDPDGKDVDVHTYRSMIGSLMYLTSSRPDIMFAVYACAHFQVTPKASHLHAVKRIFRYLKGKPHLGLWYPKDSPFYLMAYLDSDYAGASLDRKSTTEGVNTPRCNEDRLKLIELTVFLLPTDEKVRVEVNDVMRLQALVEKKKVISTEATIRDALRLDDVEGVECLPNEEIFTELAKMGYEKPSTKLTFYEAFFLSQWMFFIHTILQCMSAKRTSWNEFSSSMASAVIWCSGVETTLFKGMIVEQPDGEGAAEVNIEDVSTAGVAAEGDVRAANDEVSTSIEEPSIPSPTPPTLPAQPSQDIPLTSQVGTAQRIKTSNDTVMDDVSKQGRMIVDMDADVDVTLKDVAADVLSMQDVNIEPAELQKVVEVVTTAKLITKVVTAASATLTDAILKLTTVAAPTLTTAPTKFKDKGKGKGILGEEPKPLKKQAQIEQDEAYARELEAELNKNIDWDEVIDHV